jgi:hypothetical protein
MTTAVRSRNRGQTIVFAAIGIVALVGASALVIDLGIFFVIQRQMQNAADTAALAAVWYAPVCDPAVPACQTTWPGPHPPACTTPPRPDEVPCSVALAYADRNLDLVSGLCSGPYGNAARPNIESYPALPHYFLTSGGAVAIYVVAIDCDAPYWFGHIFPKLLSHHIAANAAATIGWRGPNGDLANSGTTLIARLFRTP